MQDDKKELLQHFNNLEIPTDATVFLLKVWDSIQTLDDYADGDSVERKRLDQLIWDFFVGIPGDAFFLRNIGFLIPALALMVQKWQASDHAEREKRASTMSFVWRAGYYDVVLAVLILTHGNVEKEAAEYIMSMYGENFNDYLKEFE